MISFTFIVSALMTLSQAATAQSPEEAAALIDECSRVTALAIGACAPQTTAGQDQRAQAIAETVGPAEQGGVQVTHQHARLSQAVYEATMALADQCEDKITTCEQSCRVLPDAYQTCHHDLRERLLAMRSEANAAVISQGMANQSHLAMTESGVDYAMGPRQGAFTIEVTKEGGGALSPAEQAAFANKFNSDSTIDKGTDGDFNGNRVVGKYDSTVTDDHIRKQASEAASSLGMGANVVVTPDKSPAAAAPKAKDPAALVDALKPTAKDLKAGVRTPKLGRPSYCAQNPWQTGC